MGDHDSRKIENENLTLGQTYEAFKEKDKNLAKEQLNTFCRAKGENTVPYVAI
jgi:hypothetical protein